MDQWHSGTPIKESLTPASHIRRANIMQHPVQSLPSTFIYLYMITMQSAGVFVTGLLALESPARH